ncbi:AraC family transcriptional regulator [Burkholderia stabilis]|uniref:Transcriptional activator feaR,DNA-binding transcriptional activator FeaR,DNA gyrase inhibitor,YSIRK-targeted surface antigen transcriptional regulator,Helix-turn-helix domain n=1 Tax=Burkholderia stabilis TaxID=95485 RepID=A0AAJ5NMA3_9BURK|nr:AraC family transcriptional regulator [Burkholderia stabilis]AOR72949.1 AraC family transcriptional regulator [Burkholderia stabilis]VBB17077.1 Transcriptional activator feaR,DNA-binding transcriptional activator FeaR,DNA gyrase inhibitor,YSIRK-targeted surface antigen transcriptional regulator,Helix-turn-helix domain [Burkholderia stabilis]HDR9490146.1 AraC family transcriptional regulator [Burkholderia stabilis]HDR9521700.1 AraC family transcriptional regulator [Burkholderia stabilis]HDR9
MDQAAFVPVFKFRTIDYPEPDRFHVWVKDMLCDYRLDDDGGHGAFDAEASGAALGPLILSGRHWRSRAPTYTVRRTPRRIRLDGQDSIRFTLLLGGRLASHTGGPELVKRAGDLFVYDVAQINDCKVDAGDVISLVVPRYLLPGHAAHAHGQTLTSGVGRLLGDQLLSLFRNLPNLRMHEIPSIVQSMLLLLAAAVAPTAQALHDARGPIDNALAERVRRYVDTHLLEPDLTPERICRDIGVSRARLYQLFKEEGGVMRQITRRRLRHAYHVLGDPQRRHQRIAEIAWAHGFPDEKYFHRLFKAEFGHTPKETLECAAAPVLLPCDAAADRWADGSRLSGWTLPFGVLNN